MKLSFKHIISLLLTIPLLLEAKTKYYAEADIDYFYEMSIEELMNVKVSTASKTSEKLSDVPSSITVFEQSHIHSMGIDNVYDLLNFVPGFQTTRDVDIIAEPSIHARGLTSMNGHVLVLMNGFRLNEVSWSRSTMTNSYIPAHNVKRVEVIRGAGSALYGSNALLGIINIITNNKQNSISVETGSFNKQAGTFNFYKPISLDFSVSSSLSFNKDKGESYANDAKDPREYINFSTNFTYKDSSLYIDYSRQEIEDFIHFNNPANSNNWSKNSTLHVMLKNEKELSEKIGLHSMVSYNQFNLNNIGLLKQASNEDAHDWLVGPYVKSLSYEADIHLEYDINSYNNIIAGVVFRREGVDYQGAYSNFISPDNSKVVANEKFYIGDIQRFKDVGQLNSQEKFINIYGLYAQYRSDISKDLTTFIGLRYDNYSIGGDSLNPRIALVYRPFDEITFKLLYGSAFRAPTNKELFANGPRSVGNDSLEPEEVETSELVMTYKVDDVVIDLTLFHNSISNTLIPEERVGQRGTWINSGEREFSGIEGSMLYQPNHFLSLRATHTHIFSDIDAQNYKDVSSMIANYHNDNWSVNMNGIFRKQQDGVLQNQGDYALINSNVIYKIKKDLEVSFGVENIFDESYVTYAPKLTRLNNVMPNRDRTWKIGFEKRW